MRLNVLKVVHSIFQLSLTGIKLKRLSDEIFQHTPPLRWIGLSRNRLEHIGQSLYRAEKDESIWLDYNRIQDIDLAAIAKMPKMIELSVVCNGFTFATTQNADKDNYHWSCPSEDNNHRCNGID